MTGKISEVFDSIQGEGPYTGQRQLFVRFFGCNLSCKFCDTKLSNFRELTLRELFKGLESFRGSYHSVSFTGGEPLLQKDFLGKILQLTRGAGFKNYLETNGTLPEELRAVIEYVDIVAMDLKLPTSTGLGDYWGEHRSFLEIASLKKVFLKAVICRSTEVRDLLEGIQLIRKVSQSLPLVLQPDSLEAGFELNSKLEEFKNICIKHGIAASVMPQAHIAWGVK